jgi:hypothetical protein
MLRMTEFERTQWMNGTRIQHSVITSHVAQGFFHCDECSATAVAIAHDGTGSAVRVQCAEHYLAHLRGARSVRPSGAELAARIAEAVEIGEVRARERAAILKAQVR